MENYKKEEKDYYGEDSKEEQSGRDNFESEPKPKKSLDTNQKIALLGLGVLMVFVLVFWSASFKKNLAINFGGNSLPADDLCPEGNCDNTAGLESLKLKDTDGDGLSDWDELYVYGTSPYLVDTDGDGISDYEEVMAGTDPNCPLGRNCAGEEILSDQPAEPRDVSTTTEEIIGGGNLDGLNQEDLNKILSGQTEAAQIRQMLIESGMDKALLDQVSDADLLEVYNQTLKDLK